MLLTGFDCKALWVLFLYKPLKEHRLLQAIARTNRPYEEVKEFGLIVDYVGVAKNLEEALKQFEGSFVREAKLIIRDLSASEKEFEKCIKELKGMLSGIKVRGIEDVDKAVEHLIINKKEKEFEEKAKKLRRLYELLSPCETTYKHLETYKFIVCISVMLNRYRKIGMRLDEIERMARKTYRLIQKTIGVEKIEKVGEIEIDKELSKLEKEREPISAIRVLGEIQSRTIGYRSDFYVSLRDEIEKIYEEMQEKRKVTKEVIEKIRRIQQKLEERKTEKKRLKEIFPVYEAMKDYLKDEKQIRKISTEIMEELKKNELLDKESFLKARQRKRIRAIVRKNLIKNFGLTPEVNEMERKIFVNLEEEYG
ncbi:MAG TPA: type I restriction endonuclease subunit R [Candidatus Aenigmarchaeota archaeon]|nr:type I restriction endonuclease subunit R [Candidatus Aenigmarchaeota archaeon]